MIGWQKRVWAVVLLAAGMAIACPAQTLTTLWNFNGTDGDAPQNGSLVQGVDGNFYGTTFQGGTGGLMGLGTIFKITPTGV